MGVGYHHGQTAYALGVSKLSENQRWVFKGSVAYDSQSEATTGLSVGFHF